MLPTLPVEIWLIIMDFKKHIEYREDCILPKTGMKLRSGRVIWSDLPRVGRFMNKMNYLAYNLSGDWDRIRIEYMSSIIKTDYFFVKTIKNEETKRRIRDLVKLLENNIFKIKYDLEIYLREINLTREDRDHCLSLVSQCSFFINHFRCITNNREICNRHMLSTYDGKTFTCLDFADWCF